MGTTLPAASRLDYHQVDDLVSEGNSTLLGARDCYRAPRSRYVLNVRKNLRRRATMRHVLSVILTDLQDGIDPDRVDGFARFLMRVSAPFRRGLRRVLCLKTAILAENRSERRANELQDRFLANNDLSTSELIELDELLSHQIQGSEECKAAIALLLRPSSKAAA